MKAERSKNPVQSSFIQQLKEIIPPNISLADELAEILEVSTDSAYRRLRGETAITIDEAYKICSRYNLSVDSVFSNKGNSVTFQYTPLTEHAGNFEKYLEGILRQLQNINKFNPKQMIYAAEEVPIFHSFHSDTLAAFKLFYWQRSVLHIPALQSTRFDRSYLSSGLLQLARNIRETYLDIPGIEIWTDDTIFTSIRQVEYYHESGLFSKKEDALEVLHKIRAMAESIRKSTETGTKKENEVPGSFQLYKSDVVIGTNCIQVKAGDADFAFISFNTLNSLTTANTTFCAETGHWLKNLINKSTLISGTAEKQRFQFFNTMFRNIDTSIDRIKNMAEN